MISLGNIDGYSESANSIFGNPASLFRINNSSVSIFTSKLFAEVTYLNFSAAYNTDYGTFACGYMSATVLDVPHTLYVPCFFKSKL